MSRAVLGSWAQNPKAESSANRSESPARVQRPQKPTAQIRKGGACRLAGVPPNSSGMKGKGQKPVPVVEDNAFCNEENAVGFTDDRSTCRICFEESEDSSKLISPCQCKGILTCPSLKA